MVYQVAPMCQGVYNKTEISFLAVIIDANTSWSEATQQHYCGSTTRPRRYGRRSTAVRIASIRRPWQLIARSTPRRSEQTTASLRPIFLRAVAIYILNGDLRVAHKGLGWKEYIVKKFIVIVENT